MYVKQTKNTFIRYYDDKGYITNQMTRYDRLYNETGADFLRTLSRKAQDTHIIIKKLINLYENSVSTDILKHDYLEFIKDLEDCFFVVTGNTAEECDSKDIEFSYSLGNIKTKIKDFSQNTKQKVIENTFDSMIEADQRKAHLKSIQFELTSRCNERCIHCYIPNAKKDNGTDMPYEQVCNIIDQFAEMGGIHISISGGEVFLHKDIIKIIQYCRKKDMEICILSNLIALKDEQIPYIKEANVSYIQTSLYSMEPQVHDTITTVKGSQEKTKTALEKLIAADIPVQISCPLMKANKDSYKAVLQYAQSHQIKAFSDYIMMGEANLCTDNLKNRLSLHETEKVIRDIIEYDKDYSQWIKDKRPYINTINKERYAKQALCGAGLNNICITANGDLYPCPGWQSMIVGNINRQTLAEIWNNSNELKSLRKITHGDFPKCMSCSAHKFCTMCLERNCNENNGDMFKVGKHICDVAFLMKRLHEEYQKKGLLL
ncbi:MAG: radical SAM protein [Prevotella sp.]|jgi:putative radical SAM domain protein|uniref:radical SAM/SPASM domain-containing protein n=1 Tax=Prevotella sp. TaxID=59823 RepID=UPI001CB21C16|nr:radical SAM protein [Prevotella sp.]MBF1620521.1 radical SAM protein [Prevotella sp.]